MLDLPETLRTMMAPFLFFSLLFIVFVTKWLLFPTTRTIKTLPPSPPRLPVLGNLHQVGLYPHRSLQSLAQIHGPLMLLHFGSTPILVVSSADAAREIMKTHDLVFSSRPTPRISRRLLYDCKDLSLAPYGEYWRQMRSICVLQLLSAKRVKSFRFIREEETALLVKKIEQSCASSSPEVNLSKLFASLTNDVICRVAFGRKYCTEGELGEGGTKFKKLFEELGALLGTFDVAEFIPWLGWLNYFTGLNERVEKLFKELDQFFDDVISDHIASNRVSLKEDEMDLVDVLLDIKKSSADGIPMESIKAIILDMFAAGTDTTYTALEWTMTEVLRHPHVLKKVQEEIRKISRNKLHITEDDLEKAHYLKAVIKESLRLHPSLPLLLPRESAQDVKVQGYDIAAKTTVFINSWAIGRDPAAWEEPEEFRPERFLESSIDFKGHDFQLIPFGAGRRGCPGYTFATATIEIALATLLHKFDWALPDGINAEDLDVAEAPGLSVYKKLPLLVVASPHHF